MNSTLKRWIDRWNAFWFPETTATPLAMARIIAVAAQLFWFFPSLQPQLHRMVQNPEFIRPELLIRGLAAVVPDSFFSPPVYTKFYWAVVLFGVLALIGLFTRLSLFLFALGVWIMVALYYSYGDRHHTQAVFCMFLMALAVAPSGRALSVDALIRRLRARRAGKALLQPAMLDTAMWPLRFGQVLLSLTYMETGVSKLVFGGFRWMNGYTLQGHTFTDAMARNLPLGVWLAQQHTLAIFLSVFTIAFESLFFLSLFFPRVAPFFFIAGICFQIGLYFTGGHPFFQHITLLVILLITLTPEYWRVRVSRALELLRWRKPVQARQPL
jgi:Vitamin K-dependent gamma-carboxylase